MIVESNGIRAADVYADVLGGMEWAPDPVLAPPIDSAPTFARLSGIAPEIAKAIASHGTDVAILAAPRSTMIGSDGNIYQRRPVYALVPLAAVESSNIDRGTTEGAAILAGMIAALTPIDSKAWIARFGILSTISGTWARRAPDGRLAFLVGGHFYTTPRGVSEATS